MTDNKKDKLVGIKLTRAELLTPMQRKELGTDKGMVVIETRLERKVSIQEVEEIVELYNSKGQAAAVDKYEQRIEETVDIIRKVYNQ